MRYAMNLFFHYNPVRALANTKIISAVRNSSNFPSVEVTNILRSAQAVCFDVDSTVIQEEGIDMLADYKGAGAAVADLTKKYDFKIIYIK